MRHTLGKEDKLKSKKAIELLFAEGNRVKSHPFQLIFLQKEHTSTFPIKIGFSVPKRLIKLAVNRNRVKRLMREVYRKNKEQFSKNIEEQYICMLIYTSKKEIKYSNLELSIRKVCNKFLTKIAQDEQN